jgi:hypothetical protein
MALATAIGGIIGHGFLWYFDASWENSQWINDIIDSQVPFSRVT